MNIIQKIAFGTMIAVLATGCGAFDRESYPAMNGGYNMPMFAGPMPVNPAAIPGSQDEAFLNSPPAFCDGTLLVEVENASPGQYLGNPEIDSEDIVLKSRRGGLLPPMVPSGSTAFICLESFGQHEISGTRYVGRVGHMVDAGTFTSTCTFTTRTPGGVGHHVVTVRPNSVDCG